MRALAPKAKRVDNTMEASKRRRLTNIPQPRNAMACDFFLPTLFINRDTNSKPGNSAIVVITITIYVLFSSSLSTRFSKYSK